MRQIPLLCEVSREKQTLSWCQNVFVPGRITRIPYLTNYGNQLRATGLCKVSFHAKQKQTLLVLTGPSLDDVNLCVRCCCEAELECRDFCCSSGALVWGEDMVDFLQRVYLPSDVLWSLLHVPVFTERISHKSSCSTLLFEMNCSLPYLQPPPVQEILSLTGLLHIHTLHVAQSDSYLGQLLGTIQVMNKIQVI